MDKSWKEFLDDRTAESYEEFLQISPRIAYALVGAEEFQKRILQVLEKQIEEMIEERRLSPEGWDDYDKATLNTLKDIVNTVTDLKP